jgi:hypothetical protein
LPKLPPVGGVKDHRREAGDPTFKARSARPYLVLHRPQSRDTEQCFPASCGREGSARRAGYRFSGILGRPSCVASSACRTRLPPSLWFRPNDAPAEHIDGQKCEDLHGFELGKRNREPVARSIGSHASTECLDCSVISNWTGRPVFFGRSLRGAERLSRSKHRLIITGPTRRREACYRLLGYAGHGRALLPVIGLVAAF